MQTSIIISVLKVLALRGQLQYWAMHILFALLLIRLNEVSDLCWLLQEVRRMSNYKLKEFKCKAIFRIQRCGCWCPGWRLVAAVPNPDHMAWSHGDISSNWLENHYEAIKNVLAVLRQAGLVKTQQEKQHRSRCFDCGAVTSSGLYKGVTTGKSFS